MLRMKNSVYPTQRFFTLLHFVLHSWLKVCVNQLRIYDEISEEINWKRCLFQMKRSPSSHPPITSSSLTSGSLCLTAGMKFFNSLHWWVELPDQIQKHLQNGYITPISSSILTLTWYILQKILLIILLIHVYKKRKKETALTFKLSSLKP